MKTIPNLAVAFLLFIFSESSFAQSAVTPGQFTITAVTIIPNTVNKATLSIDLKINLSNSVIDGDYYIDTAHRPKLHVSYNGKQPDCKPVTRIAVTSSGIQVILSNLTQEVVERIASKDNKITVQFDGDLVFRYQDNSITPAVHKIGTITKDAVNKKISSDLSFPADQQTKFITALNNFYYYKNNIDFGVQPAKTGKDSAQTSYTLTFNFQNLYSSGSLLKCAANDGNGQPGHTLIYYGISSRVSTNPKDSLNFIDIYPLIIRGSNYTAKLPTEWNVKAGHESTQDFSSRRVAVDASLSAIIPNLINLAAETSDRLRLKPVIDLGIKGYYDYSKPGNTFTSGQAYLGIYYYIPVYDHYAIIINDKTFYDPSRVTNPRQTLASTYTVQVGTEVPKTGFKIMFKYENGKSEFNQKQTQAVVIGLIMNLFNEKTDNI